MRTLTQGHTKKMSEIQLITFDLDDTFWDIRSTIINAEINSRKWSEDRIGEKIEWGTFEDFMKIRDELIKEDSQWKDTFSQLINTKADRVSKDSFKIWFLTIAAYGIPSLTQQGNYLWSKLIEGIEYCEKFSIQDIPYPYNKISKN